MNVVLITAGGNGSRFGMMKQFVPIHGVPVFVYILKTCKNYPIVLTLPKNTFAIAKNCIRQFKLKNVHLVEGGETRQQSVLHGLKYIKQNFPNCINVMISDANRPCISKKTINEMFTLAKKHSALVAATKSINTVCLSKGKYIKNFINRNFAYDLLMPQVFKFKTIYSAHQKTKIKNATDDSQLLKNKVKLYFISLWEGLKITTPDDYKIFELLLKEEK